MNTARPAQAARFRIFRGSGSPGIEESGVEKHRASQVGPPEDAMEILTGLADPGYCHRALFVGEGLSLLHLWFKSDFLLPRHSHDTDCLYFVVAGELRIGAEQLASGDGFFVGANVPYTYSAGERGVEVLEFRAAESFYLDLMTNNPAFWAKLKVAMAAKQASWPTEERPGATAWG